MPARRMESLSPLEHAADFLHILHILGRKGGQQAVHAFRHAGKNGFLGKAVVINGGHVHENSVARRAGERPLVSDGGGKKNPGKP
jgi:hypothetical protein